MRPDAGAGEFAQAFAGGAGVFILRAGGGGSFRQDDP